MPAPHKLPGPHRLKLIRYIHILAYVLVSRPRIPLPLVAPPAMNPPRSCTRPALKTPTASCVGPLDRRTWLKIGGLSLGSLAADAGLLNLRNLLAAEATGAPASGQRPFSVILFWANGGPSHIDMLDLKPAAPEEYRGAFRPIATNVPGLEINEHLPRLARMADRFAIVRSLQHDRAQHSGGTNRFLTGHSSRQANLADSEFPELGSVVAKHLEPQLRDIPLFIANTKFYGGGPAYLGPAYAPYMPSPNPLTSSGANTYDPVPIYNAGAASDNLAIGAGGVLTLERRTSVLRDLDRLPRAVDRTGVMNAMDAFQQRALAMLSSTRTRDAFNLQLEPEPTRARYGDTHWGKSLLTCRRLVEAGARFVQCQATFRLDPAVGRTSTWDDHAVNCDIFKSYEARMPVFDQAVSALLEDFDRRGLSENTLFIFCGEFGRTPTVRSQGASLRPGRDHWPKAMSVFLAGGGLRMGQVIGATNRKGEEPIDRIMDSNCLLATLYHCFGIDPEQAFLDNAGRPIPILPSGEPIHELLA